MLVLIKGAGDLATGVAVRLKRAGMDIVMTDLVKPSAIRRSVAFSEAMYHGTAKVESITAVLVPDAEAAKAVITQGNIPILADETGRTALTLCPDTMVDAIIAKRNTGTSISDAPVVIALGPGFTVGTDCHAAVETKRGHYMGRVYYEKGQSLKDTAQQAEITSTSARGALDRIRAKGRHFHLAVILFIGQYTFDLFMRYMK